MDINKMIEEWSEKHYSILIEYSKGNANNEVMKAHRTQMQNILEFIKQLNQIKDNLILKK